MTGLVAGLVMGDVPKAMIVTAALQMIYMGVFHQVALCQQNHQLRQRLLCQLRC